MVLATVWEKRALFSPGGRLMRYNASKGIWQRPLPQAAQVAGTQLVHLSGTWKTEFLQVLRLGGRHPGRLVSSEGLLSGSQRVPALSSCCRRVWTGTTFCF